MSSAGARLARVRVRLLTVRGLPADAEQAVPDHYHFSGCQHGAGVTPSGILDQTRQRDPIRDGKSSRAMWSLRVPKGAVSATADSCPLQKQRLGCISNSPNFELCVHD